MAATCSPSSPCPRAERARWCPRWSMTCPRGCARPKSESNARRRGRSEPAAALAVAADAGRCPEAQFCSDQANDQAKCAEPEFPRHRDQTLCSNHDARTGFVQLGAHWLIAMRRKSGCVGRPHTVVRTGWNRLRRSQRTRAVDTAGLFLGVLAACVVRVDGVRFKPEQLGYLLDHDV